MDNIKKKIVPISSTSGWKKAIDDITEKINKHEIIEFVIAAKRRVPDDEVEEAGCRYQIINTWFGNESSISVLGLLQYMIAEVQDYIHSLGWEEIE